MKHNEHMTFPDMITLMRLLVAPVLIILAYLAYERLFIGILIFSMFTDVIDGYFARRMHSESKTGSVLDSRADLATYMAMLAGGLLLWSDLIVRQKHYIIVMAGGYVFSALVGFIKFRRFPSYHTLSAKLSAIMLNISVLFLFGMRITIFFQITAYLLVYAYIENIAITLMITDWRHDIPSVFHAIRNARQSGSHTSE